MRYFCVTCKLPLTQATEETKGTQVVSGEPHGEGLGPGRQDSETLCEVTTGVPVDTPIRMPAASLRMLTGVTVCSSVTVQPLPEITSLVTGLMVVVPATARSTDRPQVPVGTRPVADAVPARAALSTST